jgi:phosphatidylinositol N-acetylglucosaminyltransferase subunit H
MTEESFLIMRSLGVQVTTKMRFPLASHSRFIPASQIDDVFLYEGFKGMEVRYYLAVVVHGEEDVEVVFPV